MNMTEKELEEMKEICGTYASTALERATLGSVYQIAFLRGRNKEISATIQKLQGVLKETKYAD
jgi:hypothetical protein